MLAKSASPAARRLAAADERGVDPGRAPAPQHVRYWLRELIASPSASRTVGAATISTGMHRSATMRRMTVSCWKSFSPNTATCGSTMWKSFATTVLTPSK